MANHSGASHILRVVVLMSVTFCVVALILYWYIRPKPFEPPATDAELADVNYKKSFEFEDTFPTLDRAAGMSPEDAIRLLLQKTAHLRTYMAIELKAGCRSESLDAICIARLGDPPLEGMITKKIDDVIAARINSKGAITSVDYTLSRQPFPFTVIVALKSNVRPYASLVFYLPDGNSTTLSSIQQRYGAPDEQTVDNESYPLLSYKKTATNYTAKIEFQMDPNSREAKRVSINLQRQTGKS